MTMSIPEDLPPELSTSRLVLRQWRDDDLEPFVRLNADPAVMRFFPHALSRAESDELAARIRALLAEQGWGLWAVEVDGVASFVGFVGLNRVAFAASFTPAIEVGWRLDRPYWGRGYATEAARAALEFGFDRLACREIVSFTATLNVPSVRVMERLGMTHDPSHDFDHPSVANGPLRRHLLYRLDADTWRRRAGGGGAQPQSAARGAT